MWMHVSEVVATTSGMSTTEVDVAMHIAWMNTMLWHATFHLVVDIPSGTMIHRMVRATL